MRTPFFFILALSAACTPLEPYNTPVEGDLTEAARLDAAQTTSALWAANTLDFEVLDAELDVRAATGIVDLRPFDTLEALDAVPYVGASALETLAELGDLYMPNDHETFALWAANELSFDTLDAVLDVRAANGIVEHRPFDSYEALDAVPYVGAGALAALAELGDLYMPGDDEAMALFAANELDFDTLDAVLDVRAATNIVDNRPFASFEDLDAVPYVGANALAALADLGAAQFGVCIDDDVEDNDTEWDAVPLPESATDLKVSSGDDDHWLVNVPAGMTVTVSVDFVDDLGDIDAHLYLDDVIVDYSVSVTDGEMVTWTNDGTSDREARLQVSAWGDEVCNSYDVDVQLLAF